VKKIIAAVDLGSNSFHLIIAEPKDNKLTVLERRRETIRLGAGLDPSNNISVTAIQKALTCLGEFSSLLKKYDVIKLKAVGTHTLRVAKNAEGFVAEAERKLGFPIQVISGIEEAALIYRGAADALRVDDSARLVIDIGGGSTEFIRGQAQLAQDLESLPMGCVNFQTRYFSGGEITSAAFEKAVNATKSNLELIRARFLVNNETCIGTSGTMQSVRDVALANGWMKTVITPQTLAEIRKVILSAKHVDFLTLEGLRPNRILIFPSGIAILSAIFEVLGISKLTVIDSALREGLLSSILD